MSRIGRYLRPPHSSNSRFDIDRGIRDRWVPAADETPSRHLVHMAEYPPEAKTLLWKAPAQQTTRCSLMFTLQGKPLDGTPSHGIRETAPLKATDVIAAINHRPI